MGASTAESDGAELSDEILHRLADTAKQRAALEERLRRMRDLYELGDLDRPGRPRPGPPPDATRQLLNLLFEKVWLDERRVVAVQPKPAFAPFFRHPHGNRCKRGV